MSMKSFLKAAFNITPFQILLIFIFAGIKYALIEFKLVNVIKTPFLIILLISFSIFLVVVGIKGKMENEEKSFETWSVKNNTLWPRRLLVTIMSWVQTIPIILCYLLAIYFFASTTVWMFILFFAWIVLANCFNYFMKKDSGVAEDI